MNYTNSITEIELSIIEKRCNLAKPGPWKSMVEGRDFLGGSSVILTGIDGKGPNLYISPWATQADMDFVAHSRQDTVNLINVIRNKLNPIKKESSTISDSELSEIEARCNKATPGPWISMMEGLYIAPQKRISLKESPEASMEDFDFIAHAREDLPKLIEVIKAL